MSNFIAKLPIVVLVWIATAITTFAQQAPAPDVVEQSRSGPMQQPLAGFQSFWPAEELGSIELVNRTPPPPIITVYTSQSYFHTDNLFLNPFLHLHADAWVGAFGASYVPYSTYRWTPRLTVEGALNRFDPFSRSDFNTESIAFDNRLGLTDNNLLTWAFNVSALTSQGERSGVGEFYKRVEIGTGLDWFVPLSRNAQWLLQVSPRISTRIAHPESEDRYDATLTLGLIRSIGSDWTVEPYIESGGAYYPNNTALLVDRKDLQLRGGMNVTWRIADHWTASASANWYGNYSTAPGANYQILPDVTFTGQFAF